MAALGVLGFADRKHADHERDTPMGTFRKKTLCQPNLSTKSPPTTGPAARATPEMPAQMPMA